MRSFQRTDTLDPVPGSIVATLRTIDLAELKEGGDVTNDGVGRSASWSRA
jgi:hypothetical protein